MGAIIRDPEERLISAWKSKVACKSTFWHTDGRRDLMELIWLANRSGLRMERKTCLSFRKYVEALKHIHDAQMQNLLNTHFLPQAGVNTSCFARRPPEMYSAVLTTASMPSIARNLSSLFTSTQIEFPHSHSTNNVTF